MCANKITLQTRRLPRIFWYIAIGIVCTIPLLFSFNRGINYFDEGYIVDAAYRISSGQTIYRDFHFIYTPLSAVTLAALFSLLGQTLIVERLFGLFVHCITIVLIIRLMYKNHQGILPTLLATLSYSVWGPMHINFVWPVMLILPLFLLLVSSLTSSRFFIAGSIAALILMTKQNFGISLTATTALCIILQRRETLTKLARFFLGFCLTLLPFLLWLLMTSSFFVFISDVGIKSYKALVQGGVMNTGWGQVLGGPKSALYLAPLILSGAAAIHALINKEYRQLTIHALAFVFVITGLYPTVDRVHLTPLLSIMSIMLLLYSPVSRTRSPALVFHSIGIGSFIILGLYSSLFMNYYRWEAPLRDHLYCFTKGALNGICTDQKNYSLVTHLIPRTQEVSGTDHLLFPYFSAPLFPFITRTSNPSAWIDNTIPLPLAEQEAIITRINSNYRTAVLTRFPLSAGVNPSIERFIQDNYNPVTHSYEFSLWKRKLPTDSDSESTRR